MKQLVFKNKGIIDPKSITTFGVSAKGGENPIGFFGTGLKYAIAILLRENCEITIISGGKINVFTKSKQSIRGKEFEFICMNGQELGFTTELGKNWETWKAIREVWCNCIDEDGEVEIVDSCGVVYDLDGTSIILSGDKVFSVWAERDSIILNSSPIYANEYVEVHSGASNHLYYRGVRVADLKQSSLYTYNIKEKTTLTEDRTVKDMLYARWAVGKGISNCTNADIIKNVVTASDNDWENGLQFSSNHSQQFIDVVKKEMKKLNPKLSREAIETINGNILVTLEEQDPKQLNKVDQVRLDKAISFCQKIGFAVGNYPIVVLDSLGENVLGQAANDKIYIAYRVFTQGTKALASTLIEEYVHLAYGYADNTYQMQTYLFDVICTLGEQLVGEPI
jgi:hypothetical protein